MTAQNPSNFKPTRIMLNRRRDIAEAAVRVLQRDGYAQLTARKVASEAGISLGHITYNFGSMEELLAEAYRLISQRLRLASEQSLAQSQDEPIQKLEAFLRAGFTEAFLNFPELRVRLDLWSAACSSRILAETERALYDHYRQTLEQLLMPLAGSDAAKQAAVPALLDSIMATQDGLWLDWMRRRDHQAVENGIRMIMTLVRAVLCNKAD